MRSSTLAIVKIVVVAGLLTGCAGTSTDTLPRTTTPGPTVSSSTGTADLRVTLTRSGGLAGRTETLTVGPDGRWTVAGRGGALRRGELSPADLDRLRALTGTADPGGGGGTVDAGCADTYRYRLTLPSGSVAWTDCPTGPQPPPTAAEIAHLLLAATGLG
ncbi:hypothetical protein E1193_24340 [Micromonospora sp. KC606]|uniref:hypothetical protein n=1 Tax=Micromonospora sp. KC606 TaxID=2530379 RepID=UPI001044C4DC|nr:hypothetical protein [Micromonospora sp. KC606]TDC76185.1 hypothetical protein E1193_24340 [Micromonospora sp. KC606]